MGWVGDVHHAQPAIIPIGDIGVVPSHSHVIGHSRSVVGTSLGGNGRVGDVHHPQTADSVGDIGVVPSHYHAIGRLRRGVDAHLGRVRGIGDVYYPQASRAISDIGVVPSHGHIQHNGRQRGRLTYHHW